MSAIVEKTIKSIRAISAEAITNAKSGHTGLPMGCAPLGYTLFANHLIFDGNRPDFLNRDRFILSAGHGSMLQYSLLHLFGYNVSMEDIKNFRQLGSICAGHPERGVCEGVEVSTGPLGQGFANAVGMAIAQTKMAKKYNKKGFPIFDHHVYVLMGDGCMMEGISSEAASLAGNLKLNKLIAIYDDNDISIDGSTDITFTEDVGKRFQAFGWDVLKVEDGNNLEEIDKAISKAKQSKSKPTLIICKTQIGYGTPLVGTAKIHGTPMTDGEWQQTKEILGWENQPFTIDDDVYFHCRLLADKKRQVIAQWDSMFQEYCQKHTYLAKQLKKQLSTQPKKLFKAKNFAHIAKKDGATRNYSGEVLNTLAKMLPNICGGSADLAESNCVVLKNGGDYSAKNYLGRNIHFGVREQAMGAVLNGIAAYGGFKVFGGTFFVFSDYLKAMMRMSCLMQLPVTYVLTHDSIGVGEDGPTHEPIEQLAGLRTMPDLTVFRPADLKETEYAWCYSVGNGVPTALVLSRQKLKYVENTHKDLDKGGYIYSPCKGTPDVILISCGSELNVAVKAQQILQQEGIKAQVVSMYCTQLFDKQSDEYKQKVLPNSVRARVAMEASCDNVWYKYVGIDGAVIGMDSFGTSAPFTTLFDLYGFTAENMAQKARELVKK